MTQMKKYYDFCSQQIATLQAQRVGYTRERQALNEKIADVTTVMLGLEAEMERVRPQIEGELTEAEAARAMATILSPRNPEDEAA